MIASKPSRTRRGSNLIEIMLIMPVMFIVTVQVTIAIRNIFQLSSIAKHRSHAVVQISALERAMRHDAHRAIRATTTFDPETKRPVLRFDFGSDHTVDYRAKKNGIVRTLVKEQKTASSEVYDLFDSMHFEFRLEESQPHWVVISAYRMGPRQTTQGRLEMHLKIRVGRQYGGVEENRLFTVQSRSETTRP